MGHQGFISPLSFLAEDGLNITQMAHGLIVHSSLELMACYEYYEICIDIVHVDRKMKATSAAAKKILVAAKTTKRGTARKSRVKKTATSKVLIIPKKKAKKR